MAMLSSRRWSRGETDPATQRVGVGVRASAKDAERARRPRLASFIFYLIGVVCDGGEERPRDGADRILNGSPKTRIRKEKILSRTHTHTLTRTCKTGEEQS